MASELSPSFVALWHVATLEARAGTFDTILPEHLFIALCRASDLPVGGLREDGIDILQAKAPAMERDMKALQRVFDIAGFDRTTAWRQVQAGLGKPGLPEPKDGLRHRNDDAKWCCDRAVRIAHAEGLTEAAPIHLLKAFVHPEASFPLVERVITEDLRQAISGR